MLRCPLSHLVMKLWAQLSDGAGEAWAGHRVLTCTTCGARWSDGIWVASDLGKGKIWSWAREARPPELSEVGL